jgi:hypothetical protein
MTDINAIDVPERVRLLATMTVNGLDTEVTRLLDNTSDPDDLRKLAAAAISLVADTRAQLYQIAKGA